MRSALDKRQVVRKHRQNEDESSHDADKEDENEQRRRVQAETKTHRETNETGIMNREVVKQQSKDIADLEAQQEPETKFIVTLTGIDENQFAKSAAGKTRRGGLFEIDALDEELIYEGEAGYDDFDMNDQPDQQIMNENFG